MLVADTFLGNVSEDPNLADRVDRTDALTVAVDGTERRRSRFRTRAEDGTDLGVVVGRELQAGDVLSADGTLVRVTLEPVDAMVVDLAGVEPTPSTVNAALALGHAVGNRHWALAVEEDRCYLPVADSRERMESEVEPNLPDGATVSYADVSPSLFDEADAGHGHSDGHSHEHPEAQDHDHSHSHGNDGHDGIRDVEPGGSP